MVGSAVSAKRAKIDPSDLEIFGGLLDEPVATAEPTESPATGRNQSLEIDLDAHIALIPGIHTV